MAKIREKQPDADAGRLIVDEQLEGLEARLTSIYEQTAKEVQADLDKFLSKYEKEDANKQAMVEADEISKSEYIEWRERRIFRTNAMQAKIDDVTTRIVHADEQAMAMVNDQLPETYATSYNFGGYRAETQAHEAGFDYTQFTIINQDAVRTLATEDPDLIPWKPEPDVEEDKRWNRQHVQNAVLQGITKGDSMPDVAKRLLPVVNMDKNAAIRTARTAVNGIENKGRKDATERVKAAGIPMVEVWSATHDQRTRDTHILLDGTEPDENGMYGKGIISKLLAYPGDPSGDPEEVYNCRCGLISQIKGIDHSKDDELYAKMMEEEYFEDWVQVKEERQEKEAAFQKNKEGAAERVAAKQAKKEEKSKEDKLQDLGVKSITADDIDLDRLNFTDGRFGKYAYELGEEMQENSDDNLILELTTKGKYQDHIAYASIDEESASLEGIVSDGGGAGTELLGRVMEYQESKGEGLMWLADNPESVSYYEHLGLGEYGKGDKNEKLYEISAEEISNALEKVNEHRDIPKEQPAEELPKASELLPAEDLSSGKRSVVQGEDISDTWERRSDKFDFEIDDVIDAQGFNGLPKVVSEEKFNKAVEESNFIAQRTYSAPTQEVLDSYRDQLYNGDWYVNCEKGGAIYGQGMYCAADYTGSLTKGIESEMQNYQEANSRKYSSETSEVYYTETLTLTPDAKIIDYDDLFNMRLELQAETRNKYVDEALTDVLKTKGLENNKDAKTFISFQTQTNNVSWDEASKAYKSLEEQGKLSDVNALLSDANQAKQDALTKGNEEWDRMQYKYNDLGVFAASKGYDAINAQGHEEGVSYTVILNRSKVIFKEDIK